MEINAANFPDACCDALARQRYQAYARQLGICVDKLQCCNGITRLFCGVSYEKFSLWR